LRRTERSPQGSVGGAEKCGTGAGNNGASRQVPKTPSDGHSPVIPNDSEGFKKISPAVYAEFAEGSK